MAYWPKTVRGNLVAILLVGTAAVFLVQMAVALSGPVIWVLVATAALTFAILYTWNRRVQGVADLAAADAPSFGDTLRSRNRRDDNDARELPSPA